MASILTKSILCLIPAAGTKLVAQKAKEDLTDSQDLINTLLLYTVESNNNRMADFKRFTNRVLIGSLAFSAILACLTYFEIFSK